MPPRTTPVNWRPFSSRGPTDDGRLKPDLVAPGTHITGARPSASATGMCNPLFATGYSLTSGTSEAAPQVAGAAALVRDWYEDSESARAVAGADQGAADQHRQRPRGRSRQPAGLGAGQRRGGARHEHLARVLRPAARRRARQPRADRGPLVHGPVLDEAGQGHARLDRRGRAADRAPPSSTTSISRSRPGARPTRATCSAAPGRAPAAVPTRATTLRASTSRPGRRGASRSPCGRRR